MNIRTKSPFLHLIKAQLNLIITLITNLTRNNEENNQGNKSLSGTRKKITIIINASH